MTTEIQRRAFSIKFKRDSAFYACYPHPKFPTISITGGECALNCKHCNHRYLRHMISCLTPGVLFGTCSQLATNGSRGVLLSGGYNSRGYVPFEPFLDAIGRAKRETGLFFNLHTGLVPPSLARELGEAGVDMVSVDLIGADETIKHVLGIQRTTRDYERTLKVLAKSIPRVVPHVCIGLHGGEVKGEFRALEMAAAADIAALVFLVLIPTKGTAFEGVEAPAPAVVGKLIAEARLKFPEIPLTLGCMRPRSGERVETELQALRSGVDRIEVPSAGTIRAAERMGLKVKRLDACCAVPAKGAFISGTKQNLSSGWSDPITGKICVRARGRSRVC